ncbi:MAG: cupin domain-containing protein [Candidatus Binataceae bacterium]
MKTHTNVIHQDEQPWTGLVQGKGFRCRRKSFSGAAAAHKLGCSLFEVPPGASAFPYHYHCANEEAIYVLDGEGTLRLGEAEVALRKGHFVALPPGKQCAHRLVNSSDRPLLYLCFSTMEEPEVSIYPDSKKFGVMVGAAPGGAREKRTLSAAFKLASEVPYLEDEPDA